MNTGTPIDEKACASVCRLTVLPVPVAPVIKPCRFGERRQQREFGVAALATRRG